MTIKGGTMEWKVESPYKDWGGESYNAGARDQAKRLVEYQSEECPHLTDIDLSRIPRYGCAKCLKELRRQVGL